MSSADLQTSIFGEPSGDSVEIVTEGRTIRPIVRIASALVNEARFRFHGDGLRTELVDPANVAALKLDVNRTAFDEFATTRSDDDFVIGLNLSSLRSKLRKARMGKRTSDPVSLEFDESRTLIEVERDYESTSVTQTDEMLNIDPDAIRQSPNTPGFDHPWQAQLDVDAFHDVVTDIGDANDHIDIIGRDGRLLLAGESSESIGDYATVADFGKVATLDGQSDDDVSSKFSLDYVQSAAKALKKGKVTDLTLSWGDEYPAVLDFERTESRDGEDVTLYGGKFAVAPRIQSDD